MIVCKFCYADITKEEEGYVGCCAQRKLITQPSSEEPVVPDEDVELGKRKGELAGVQLNRIYNQDCLEGMKMIPDDSVDMTITSPPYSDLRVYGGFDFDYKAVIEQIYRATKIGGVVVWIVGDKTSNGSESGDSFTQALYFKEVGFKLHDTMIWSKGCCVFPDRTRYYQSFEYMFVFTKGKINTFNPIADRKNKHAGSKVHGTLRQKDGSTVPTLGIKENRNIKEYGFRYNVWECSPERNNKTGHPAVFPLGLIHDHIESWSNENDVILDPFMGSGTTAIACLNTNRNYIGFEVFKEYYDKSIERINEKEKQLELLNDEKESE